MSINLTSKARYIATRAIIEYAQDWVHECLHGDGYDDWTRGMIAARFKEEGLEDNLSRLWYVLSDVVLQDLEEEEILAFFIDAMVSDIVALMTRKTDADRVRAELADCGVSDEVFEAAILPLLR